MSTDSRPKEGIDVLRFRRNRDQFPDEDLVPFWGLQVAWNTEGTRVVATGATHELLYRHLKTAGIDPCQVVVEFIHDPDVSYC
jgi:hypothetical protein